MRCSRCGGFFREDLGEDEKTEERSLCLTCTACANVIDPKILENRSRVAARAEKRNQARIGRLLQVQSMESPQIRPGVVMLNLKE